MTEIQEAIGELPSEEKRALSVWLRSQAEPEMSELEEEALLAALDTAARELDTGQGVPIARVRDMVARWATR